MRRRVLMPMTVVVLLVVAVIGGTAIARRTGYMQDEQGFRNYVLENIDRWSDSRYPHAEDRDLLWAEHHLAAVVVEGDRAREWLKDRPDALVPDPLGKSDSGTMSSRYLSQTEEISEVNLHSMSRRFVVAGAWAHLCPRVREAKTSQIEGLD